MFLEKRAYRTFNLFFSRILHNIWLIKEWDVVHCSSGSCVVLIDSTARERLPSQKKNWSTWWRRGLWRTRTHQPFPSLSSLPRSSTQQRDLMLSIIIRRHHFFVSLKIRPHCHYSLLGDARGSAKLRVTLYLQGRAALPIWFKNSHWWWCQYLLILS